MVARPCCRAAYLRGAFLAAGSVSGPRNAHLELRSATATGASFLADLARAESIELRAVERAGHAVAYAKGGSAIAELLGLMGAHDAALGLEESAVVGATRSRANRLANADHANLVRTARSAQAQVRAIRRLAAERRPRHAPAPTCGRSRSSACATRPSRSASSARVAVRG